MLDEKFTPIQLKDIVYIEIKNLLTEKNITHHEIRDDLKLNANLGITSLEFARLVSILEDKFNVDPFMELVSITSVRTVGDLINAYTQALAII